MLALIRNSVILFINKNISLTLLLDIPNIKDIKYIKVELGIRRGSPTNSESLSTKSIRRVNKGILLLDNKESEDNKSISKYFKEPLI
jgi:hypothetical protein